MHVHYRMVEKFQEEKYQQEEVREERLQYIQFLKQKSQQYQGQINTVQEELSRVGYQPSLSHSSLVRISQVTTRNYTDYIYTYLATI